MRFITLAAIMTSVAVLSGCATDNRIVGNRLIQTGHWYGNMGITGALNNVTIEQRSRITKLSIVGDANVVTVEDNVTLGKVEVWGNNNTLSIPERLGRFVRFSQVGRNTIVQRTPSGEQVISPREPIDSSPETIERPQPMEQSEPAPAPAPAPATLAPPPASGDPESRFTPASTTPPANNPYITYDNPPRSVPPAGVSPGQQ